MDLNNFSYNAVLTFKYLIISLKKIIELLLFFKKNPLNVKLF
jgi:hypothetical protein